MKISAAGKIREDERDRALDLHGSWPNSVPRGWNHPEPSGAYLSRTLEGERGDITEHLIRFPSAPVYGVHRRDDYQYKIPRINYHTFRLLKRREAGDIRRIYLIHNGLNETDRMVHYYRLADELLDDKSAFIIRPFPGHLTRFPLPPRYSEQPLDRYLADAGDLYRQYLRFMVETQWLLSVIVPVRSYRVLAGLDLLAEGDEEHGGRTNLETLAGAIFHEWLCSFAASIDQGRDCGAVIELDAIREAIETIRGLIGWKPWPREVGGSNRVDLDTPPGEDDLRPTLHVLGYSLGGYVAQSVFFTWPFAISSAMILFSGGPLRNLRLAKFSNAEEWNTVMRALKYEIESSIMEGRLGQGLSRVAGLERNSFRHFHGIFHDVFLQDFRGSYSSRLDEFYRRLRFIAGTEDEIVSHESLSKAVSKGIVKSLPVTHFLVDPRQWRKFVEAGGIDELRWCADEGETGLTETLRDYWWRGDRGDIVGRASKKKQRGDEDRPSGRFQGELDVIAERLEKKGGHLFVFRNQVPVVFLGTEMLQLDGAALYHSDGTIGDYFLALQNRRLLLTRNHGKITIVIPSRLETWFRETPAILSANVETARGGLVPDGDQLRQIWERFFNEWSGYGCLRLFDPDPDLARPAALVHTIRSRTAGLDSEIPIVNALPDIWLYISSRRAQMLRKWVGARSSRTGTQAGLVALATRLAESTTGKEPRIRDWVSWDDLIISKVSAAEYNPRYMGERITDSDAVKKVTIHAALCLLHSQQAPVQ